MPFENEQQHPSWGMLQVSRVSGHVNLFGSHVTHQHFIELRLHQAVRSHETGRDWYFAKGAPHVVVQMSSAQFAELITNMNVGSGVPCTIRHVNGSGVEKPPQEVSESERIKKSFKDNVDQKDKELDAKLDIVKQLLSKNTVGKADRAQILKMFENAIYHLRGTTQFYVDQFEESVENIQAKAKTEFETYLTTAITNLGLEQLKKEPLKLKDL